MKNKPISEEEKAAIRVEDKQARKAGKPPLKSIALEHGIHPTMISKIAPNGTAKRKTAKTAKKTVKATAPVIIDALLKEYKKTLAKVVEIRKQIDNEIEKAVNS